MVTTVNSLPGYQVTSDNFLCMIFRFSGVFSRFNTNRFHCQNLRTLQSVPMQFESLNHLVSWGALVTWGNVSFPSSLCSSSFLHHSSSTGLWEWLLRSVLQLSSCPSSASCWFKDFLKNIQPPLWWESCKHLKLHSCRRVCLFVLLTESLHICTLWIF